MVMDRDRSITFRCLQRETLSLSAASNRPSLSVDLKRAKKNIHGDPDTQFVNAKLTHVTWLTNLGLWGNFCSKPTNITGGAPPCSHGKWPAFHGDVEVPEGMSYKIMVCIKMDILGLAPLPFRIFLCFGRSGLLARVGTSRSHLHPGQSQRMHWVWLLCQVHPDAKCQ